MKFLLLSILTAVALFGCSSSDERVGRPSGGSNEMVGPTDLATDPVTDAPVRTDSAWKTEWKGNWYFFESEANLKKFQSDPTAYVTEDGYPQPNRRKVYPHEVR